MTEVLRRLLDVRQLFDRIDDVQPLLAAPLTLYTATRLVGEMSACPKCFLQDEIMLTLRARNKDIPYYATLATCERYVTDIAAVQVLDETIARVKELVSK